MPAAECSPAQLRERALALLARREHSRRELADKLTRRGFDAGEVAALIAQLAADGWQSEARFAEVLVRSRIGAGYGPLRIRAELARHGIDADTAAQALAETGDDADWLAVARDLLARRHGRVRTGDSAGRARRLRFLQQRGFPAGIARRAVLDATADEG